MALTVKSHGAVEIRVDGIGVLPGPWRTFTGGALTMEPTKIKPGHMLPGEAIPNPATVEDITASANYDLAKWHELIPGLRAAMAQGARVSATRLFLDHRQRVFGRGDTYTGIITRVEPHEYDTDSDDSGDIMIGIGPDDTVSR